MKPTVKEKRNGINTEIKSFVDYFVEKSKIDTKDLQCIRTYGWGDKAVIRVEYADFHKDFKPVNLAKQYLKETYGYCPKNLNFNNAHFDRISCSCLNVYDVDKEEFNTFSEMPTVIYSKYHEKEDWGEIEFAIHNEQQNKLSYEGRLFEYFNNTMKTEKSKEIKIKLVNVTGSEDNEWCLFELNRAGFPQGSIIIAPFFNKNNNSFIWSKGGYDCVAYLGETCEIIN